MVDAGTEKQGDSLRGAGRGSNFMVLDRAVMEEIWSAPSRNRMNLLGTFLVLLAGTGSDHALTKWSATACEEHLGIGRPRAKAAIEELIDLGVIRHSDASTAPKPQYQIQRVPAADADVIFLPNQLVTGFRGEASILRRIRETGDSLTLRMLLDLYSGLDNLDVTQGVPLTMLRGGGDTNSAVQAAQVGVHCVWALTMGGARNAGGDWVAIHKLRNKAPDPWEVFWERVRTLERIGAIWFEPWVFESAEIDAEPLWPVDLAPSYSGHGRDEVTDLTFAAIDAATALFGDREYLVERHSEDVLVPLPQHHSAPHLRGVARLKVEPDTPGFRRSYGARKFLIERRTADLKQLAGDTRCGIFNRPLGSHRREEAA